MSFLHYHGYDYNKLSYVVSPQCPLYAVGRLEGFISKSEDVRFSVSGSGMIVNLLFASSPWILSRSVE
jgi:hypothetical protein